MTTGRVMVNRLSLSYECAGAQDEHSCLPASGSQPTPTHERTVSMLTSFQQWWRRPLRTRDRVAAVFIGIFGGFWIGFLGRLMLVPMPVDFVDLGLWAIGGMIAGAVLGVIFPRAVSVALFPFSIFG